MEMRIFMNKKEEFKTHVMKCLVEGNMTVKQASKRLGFSERYVKKLKARYRKFGALSMLHGNCGRQPKHTFDPTLKQRIIEIRKDPLYADSNIIHFMEILDEEYNINVSYSYLYRLLRDNGIKSPRNHKKIKNHHRRQRRARLGELLQADATSYTFFSGDKQRYTLHGFIDDATGKITGLYMCKNECMQGYFEVTRQTLQNFGIPESIYADGSSIFFTNKKEKLTIEEELNGVEKPVTQYSRIMEELGITMIKAMSSQAKGRIERLWNTLQDRLVTEFRINNITNTDEANVFLERYIKKFNKQFGKEAKEKTSSFLKLMGSINLDILLTVKYRRQIDNGGCFKLNNIYFKVEGVNIPPKAFVNVLISKKIGMKVMYNEKLYKIIPIIDKNNIEISNTESITNIIQEFIYFNCLKNERIA